MSNLLTQARARIPRVADAAVERARLTVVPRERNTRAGRVPFAILVSAVLLGGVIGLLVFNTSMQQASFKATALQAQADLLQAREQGLEMRLDRLRDPQRVAERARTLGMVPIGSPAFLRLSDGKVLGDPLPATPDQAMALKAPRSHRPSVIDPRPVTVIVTPKHHHGANHGSHSGSHSGSHNRSHHGAAGSGNGGHAGTKNQQHH